MDVSKIGKALLIAWLLSGLSAVAKEDPLLLDGEVFNLETFVIYERDVEIIDGFTGNKYDGDNEVVLSFADTFNQILLNYHRKLLLFEIRHLNFRIQDGIEFEKELAALADSFGIKNFKVDHNQWLIKEKAILHRLNDDPFYRIEALIAWDEDKLNAMLPDLPKTKYAKDIRYNEQKGIWERRVTTEWKVSYRQGKGSNRNPYGNPVNILKEQGLNLDTNEGYHFINRGLSNYVYPDAFKDVKLTYPIIVSSSEPEQEQIDRLRKLYVQNLYYIYDPFSWVARRNTRFRGGFYKDLLDHFEKKRRFNVSNRDWFDQVFCKLLSDVINAKRHGTKEIYSLYAYQRFHLSPNILGEDLDLLNWKKGENREGVHKGENTKIYINWKNPGGARFIILDAYMRYTDQFLNALRTNLTSQKKKADGKEIFQKTIEEVSGVPFDIYVKKAAKAQKEMILKYK